jgi:hypothetical protein
MSVKHSLQRTIADGNQFVPRSAGKSCIQTRIIIIVVTVIPPRILPPPTLRSVAGENYNHDGAGQGFVSSFSPCNSHVTFEV